MSERQLDDPVTGLGKPPVLDAYEFLYDWLPEDSEPSDVPQAVHAAAAKFNGQVAAFRARLEEKNDD